MEKDLPVCPVETTLMLISDRWKVLIIRRYKTIWRNKKIYWECITKSFNCKFALNGRQRVAYPKSISRSTATGRIYFNRNRV